MPGRLFNDYDYSSYLQWAMAGKPALFIDLMNAYPDSVMRDYADIINARPRGIRLLDKYNITRVFLRPHSGEGRSKGIGKISTYLGTHWKRVYWYKDDSVYRRLKHGEKSAVLQF